ncbi:MOSC domain-containing protein [Pseudomonas aeruginosa]
MQQVIAVSLCATHAFSKQVRPAIRLLKGLGVEGDAHHGVTVKHRSRVRQDPTQPNLRQVHLIHEELHDELRASGFAIGPGTMGENITTRGVDLLGLPTGTRLRLGESALVELTGLRNPCSQLDNYQPGLTAAVLGRDEQGNLIRKAGVMAIVLEDGEVRPGDAIDIQLPPLPHRALEKVLRQSAAIPGELCARACVPMLASTAQPQGVTACTSSHWRHCS